MDSMAFGMGCCCLQITMQVDSERSSRYLHDQLAVLSPILMALSASSPIFKGKLTDKDCRWSVISQSVDDRTPAERGLILGGVRDPQMVGGGIRILKKSRYSSISRFIGKSVDKCEDSAIDKLNDIEAEENEVFL